MVCRSVSGGFRGCLGCWEVLDINWCRGGGGVILGGYCVCQEVRRCWEVLKGVGLISEGFGRCWEVRGVRGVSGDVQTCPDVSGVSTGIRCQNVSEGVSGGVRGVGRRWDMSGV